MADDDHGDALPAAAEMTRPSTRLTAMLTRAHREASIGAEGTPSISTKGV